MSKHDRAAKEKQERNLAYAVVYRQHVCSNCGHKTCKRGTCRICGGSMR